MIRWLCRQVIARLRLVFVACPWSDTSVLTTRGSKRSYAHSLVECFVTLHDLLTLLVQVEKKAIATAAVAWATGGDKEEQCQGRKRRETMVMTISFLSKMGRGR
ncbi:hypothetical protein B296_00009154 [Ensete ventricosum]|uniref:Uncharacterized protein n=1 Tax=Ensete ventricosum TaxID=4639 RepID=A0A427B9N3_ENSVE|nr:hypothetical protein B296_00009154 [Ensete ventricosum]